LRLLSALFAWLKMLWSVKLPFATELLLTLTPCWLSTKRSTVILRAASESPNLHERKRKSQQE
jgi:hypothetical protein